MRADSGGVRAKTVTSRVWGMLTALVFAAGLSTSAAAATTDYTYTTATNASLTDMSTGTTQLVAANSDDTASPVTNIGFDFYMLGTRYTQFSASSNGFVRLGGTAVTGGTYALGAANVPLIASLGSDLRTSATGRVHFKVLGSAPNRVLVIEFLNMTIIYDAVNITADGTSQVRLYETTGVIELVYGAMNRNASQGFQNGNDPQHIGFSLNSTAGTIASVDTANVVSTAGTTLNQFPLSTPMASLTSANQGERRIYSFAPAIPAAPTDLTFTAVTPLSMTLNWTDAPTESLYAVFRSTDGINYSFQSTLPANTTTFAAAGLSPSTNYFWQVFAISDGAFSSALSGAQATGTPATISSTAAGGLWSDTATWVGGVIPVASDNVSIVDGATVTIDTAAVALNLTVGTGGAPAALVYEAATARSLAVGLGLTIASNGSLTTPSTGTVITHALSVGADLSNAGVLDFSTNGDTAGGVITFAGASSNTFGGNGATTDVRAITIAKGARENVLTVSPSNFTVRGVTTDSAGFLTVTSGTFRLAGSFAGTNRVFGVPGYTIAATGGFWLDNPNYTVAPQTGSGTVAGLFRMSQGTFNIGTVAGNSLSFNAGSVGIVEGGTISSAGRFAVGAAGNAFSYTQTGGTITVATVGNTAGTASFDMGTSTASSISISGGTIVVQLANTNATPRDYRHQAGSTGITTVTGGTLQLGNGSSGAAKTFNVAGVLPNLVISNESGNHSANFGAPAGFNNITRDITINTGNTLNFGNQVFLFNGTTLTNNGTLTHNGATSNFVWFTTTAPVLYTGSGVVTAPMTAMGIQADQGLTLDAASPSIVANAVRLFSGNVINANKLTVGNGGTTTATVQIGNTTTPTAAGTFDSQLGFNAGSGGITLSYLRTTAARVTGGEVPTDRSVSRLTYDNNDPTHSLTLAGGDLNVTTQATLTNGRIITGASLFNLTQATGTVVRTNGYVDGNLRKIFDVAANKTFEVGSANGYSPVSFNVTAGTLPAVVTARAVGTTAPGFVPASRAITRHWNLTAADITADLTFSYLDPQDLPGTVTEADLVVYRGVGGVYTDLGGTVDTTANTAVITGVTTFSDWTLGMPAGASLSISPTVVDFGNQSIGVASGAQSVTLTNKGTLSLEITALTAAAAPFAQIAGGTCTTVPITIAAKSSCTVNYTFTPAAAGPFSQLFTATTTAPGSNTYTLQGNGVGAANLTIAPATVNFGSVNVGSTSAEQSVTLGNNGTIALNVSAITVANAPFARTATGTCSSSLPFSIPAGSTCTLTYTFSPTTGGAATQSISVTGDGTGNGAFDLNGTGTTVDAIFDDGFEDPVR